MAMQQKTLSNRTVAALTVDRDTVFWDRDLTGFGVRVYPSGGKVWIAQARGPEGPKRITVGRHDVLNADQARQRAALIIARIKAGEDPVPLPLAARLNGGPTVANLAERYLEEHVSVRLKPRTQPRIRGMIANHILPALGRMPLEGVERGHVVELHRTLSDRPASANRAVKILSHMYRLGAGWGLVPEGCNPCRSVEKFPERSRERFLTDAEFARLGRVLEETVESGAVSPLAAAAKRLLTEERVPGGTAIARFVGVDAYEDAGGTVMRDLFAEEYENGVWFEDPVLLEKLATEKLQAAADELSTRWTWATPMIEAGWDDTAHYGRIEPQPGVATEEERAEIEKLETRYDELRGLDDDEWTEALVEEAGRIEARLDELEGAVEARAMWRREDFSVAGCIATIGNDGSLQVIAGLVRPEDMPKTAESGGAATQAGNGHDPDAAAHGVHTTAPAVAQPVAGPRDREAEARKEAGVGIGLADDQRSIRTALVKAYLAGDFEASFDLTLFQMGRAVFRPGYHDHALDIAVKETPDRPNIRMNDADFADWSPGEAMLEDRSHLSLDWLTIEDDGESFAALRALPRAEKEALFAACVARTVKGQLAFEPQARPELEATIARLDIDFAKHVRPTAAMYWSRIRQAAAIRHDTADDNHSGFAAGTQAGEDLGIAPSRH